VFRVLLGAGPAENGLYVSWAVWNLLGHAVKEPLAGKRLRAIPHVDAFWFAWAAFHPSTTIFAGP
jgi:hypothetical protein